MDKLWTTISGGIIIHETGDKGLESTIRAFVVVIGLTSG
jgi:hypothetical protein